MLIMIPQNTVKMKICPKDIDVSFIGTLHGGAGRRKNIKYLSANGINIEIFGWDSPNRRITFEKKRLRS